MNPHARLPIEIEVVRYPGQRVLRIRFHRDALSDWCLGLSLLKEGLVESFTVIEQQARAAKVKFLAEPQVGARARITFRKQS